MGKKFAQLQFQIPNSKFLIAVQPPQPPTAPAPAVRPTPPTPPRIDMSPFSKSSADDASSSADESEEISDAPQVNHKVDTPESMARDAVANGAGALTKRTFERGDDNQSAPANQTVTVIPPDAPLISDEQSDYDRGQDVLKQFRDMDAQPAENFPTQSSTEQSKPVAIPKLNYHEGNGAPFWLFTIIFVAIAAFVVVKKFLLTDKPALTKSQLFEDSSSKLKAVTDKVKPARQSKSPASKPKSPPKDDDKGKHFEVRV